MRVVAVEVYGKIILRGLPGDKEQKYRYGERSIAINHITYENRVSLSLAAKHRSLRRERKKQRPAEYFQPCRLHPNLFDYPATR